MNIESNQEQKIPHLYSVLIVSVSRSLFPHLEGSVPAWLQELSLEGRIVGNFTRLFHTSSYFANALK